MWKELSKDTDPELKPAQSLTQEMGGSSAFGIWPSLRTQARGCPGTRFWRESTALSTPKQVRTSIIHRAPFFGARTVGTCL